MTQNPARRIAGAFLALGAGEVIGRLLAFATTIVIARVLGAEGYGVYALALAVGLYLAKASECGLEGVGVRAIAERGSDPARLASAVSGVRIIAAVVLIGLAGAVTQWSLPDPERGILLLSFLVLVPVALDTRWVLIGLERAAPVAWARVVGEATTLIGVLWLVDDIGDVDRAVVCYMVGVAVTTAGIWIALRRSDVRVGISWDPGLSFPLLKRGLPIAGQILLGLLIFNADLFLLRVLRDAESVGLYAAAYAPLAFAVNVGYAFAYSVLPVIVAERASGADASDLYAAQVVRALTIALPLAAGAALLAVPIMVTGFGSDYAASGPALAALMMSAPFAAATALSWTALTALGREGWLIGATALAAVLNIGLNLLWIPEYGMLGAAAATAFTEAFRAVLTAWVAFRGGLRFPTLGPLAAPLLATGAMAAFLALVEWPLWAEAPAATVLYFGALATLGFIGRGLSSSEPRAPR